MHIKVHYTAHPEWNQDGQTFDLGEMKFKSHLNACSHMFGLFNAVEPNPSEGKLGYYCNKFNVRSMCIRDIVEVDGISYVCLPAGWAVIEKPELFNQWVIETRPVVFMNEQLQSFKNYALTH